jgi:predicted PurR-regulated permease PerM
VTRQHLGLAVLVVVSIVFGYYAILLFAPFFASLTWALVLAVFGAPVHRWFSARFIRFPGVAAALATAAIAILIMTPLLIVANSLAAEAAGVGDFIAKTNWNSIPGLNRVAGALKMDLNREVARLMERSRSQAAPVVGSTVWSLAQALISLLFLFYFFRDRQSALNTLRSLSPLSDEETNRVFDRVRQMVYATVYGSLTVAAIQGALGGVIFWFLGLPAPVFWAFVMGVLSVLPVMGAFTIWGPAAVYLAVQGEWWKAVALTGWGMLVIGLIDNLLFPILVGKDLRLHPVPIFVALLGGITLFGASGLVLGPLVLTVSLALLEVWRLRTQTGPLPT